MNARFALPSLVLTGAVVALAGCVPNAPSGADSVTVTATDDGCTLSSSEAPAGTLVFSVENEGSAATEFYLLASDGSSIVSEVENIGPGLTRDLTVQVAAGGYFTSCRESDNADAVPVAFTVTEAESDVPVDEEREALLNQAAQTYRAYVQQEVAALVIATDEFVAAYTAGDDDAAREIYAPARIHWEAIEPVAESFGDLDPSMDLREADLAEGEQWTGWHAMEKDLWPPLDYAALSVDERQALADQLVADTAELSARVNADDFTFEAFQIGNGAKELLDEVATGKITGEEEIWSGTDLWDFRANLDGAWEAYVVLKPAADLTDATLSTEIEERFAALDAELAQYGSLEDGFANYSELTDDQVVELSRLVEALSESLSHLTAAAIG
ncbi:EfeM/EfeO family lipoprotein [Demequina sp. TTPB684]|uniref:iron uptake system protein EfeO n=1 Tax=unclassified Demequina TaxID=2620311 RepID=UPI001CF28C5F|nr:MULTISPECIES: iron uptake system protein EfeO [unclassified Demequina]MCB2411583.1 EfeM/EfeO family lipoprotein [Demequina sp. TTPB684]UPU87254.1 EfeM/EfeO family lipoprotein [Demequina sp. TMPB413]